MHHLEVTSTAPPMQIKISGSSFDLRINCSPPTFKYNNIRTESINNCTTNWRPRNCVTKRAKYTDRQTEEWLCSQRLCLPSYFLVISSPFSSVAVMRTKCPQMFRPFFSWKIRLPAETAVTTPFLFQTTTQINSNQRNNISQFTIVTPFLSIKKDCRSLIVAPVPDFLHFPKNGKITIEHSPGSFGR